jgi:hypothetical protein
MDRQVSEATLQDGHWCGAATPNGTLSIAKGVLANLASPSCCLGASWWHAAQSASCCGFGRGSSRRGGRDATRRTEARNPCATGQHKAPGDLALARLSRPAGRAAVPAPRPLPAAMVLVRRLVATVAERVQQVLDVAWVGVDAGLFAALTATGWAAWRHTWGRGGHDRHRDAALVGCVVRPGDRVGRGAGRGDRGGGAGGASPGALSLYFGSACPSGHCQRSDDRSRRRVTRSQP